MDKYLVTPKATIAGDTGESFPEIRESDAARIGQNAMAGDSAIVDDFVIKPGGEIVVEGGDFLLGGGLSVNIYKPLRAWRGTDGKQFSDFDPTPVEIEHTADPDDPRIDLIYVLLQEDVDGAQETRHFKKDPTDANSLEGDVAIYSEKQNKLTVMKAAGTPAETPAAPALPANAAPLYEVTVPAGATSLSTDNVRDVRHNFDTLEEVNERVAALEDDLNVVKENRHRHPADQVDIGKGAGKFTDLTVQEAMNILGNQDDEEADDPVFRPEIITPELAPYAAASGKLGSSGVLDGATPAVDIPVRRSVSFFGGSIFPIEPGRFPATVEGVALNARYVNKNVNQATNSRQQTVNLNLASISSIVSDGGGTFTLKDYELPFTRSRSHQGQRLACAYSDSKIVLMGGAPLAGDSAVLVIDTVTGTVTQKTLTGDVPNFYIRGVFPCGDGIHVICAQQPGADTGINGGKLEWFRVNMSTLVSTKFTGTAPGYTADDVQGMNGCGVIGDLIAPDIILILIRTNVNGVNASALDNKLWVYHCDTNTFEMFTPVGQNPLAGLTLTTALQDVDVCCYQNGQAVLVRGAQGIATHVFDYASRSWTKLNISQPSADQSSVYGARLWGVTLSNIGGRVYLTSETSTVWQLTPGSPAAWSSIGLPAGFGGSSYGRGSCGFASLLGANNLPVGSGYVLGGRVANQPKKDIWAFSAAGIVQAACGLTLGEGVRQASFVLDDGYQLPWEVAKVVGNPLGNLPAGSIKLEVQFDNEAWIEVKRDTIVAAASTGSNPRRRWRFTLFGAGATKPCISALNEIFEQDAGPGLVEVVIRLNVIVAGVRYLYIDRDGNITMETTAQQTTPNKCLLMKITPNGGLAPTPFDYCNKRWLHRKYVTTRAGGSTPAIANDLPFLPSFIRAYLKESDGTLKDKADPTVTFNTDIAITLASDGQACILELAG